MLKTAKDSLPCGRAPVCSPQCSRITTHKLPQCSHRKPTQSSKTKLLPLQTGYGNFGGISIWDRIPPDFAKLKHDSRPNRDALFRRGYNFFGREKRSIITSGGERVVYSDKSTGVTWVGVCWKKSTCVVYKNEDLEKQKQSRLTGSIHESIQMFLSNHLLCEIEDIADPSSAVHQQLDLSGGEPLAVGMIADIASPSSALHQQFDLSDGKPYAVVSVCPAPSNAHEETYAEASVTVPGEIKAIEFLGSKMNDARAVAYSCIVQTTIEAFQHLFQRKFNGDELRVPQLEDGSMFGLMPHQIDEHLAIINKAG